MTRRGRVGRALVGFTTSVGTTVLLGSARPLFRPPAPSCARPDSVALAARPPAAPTAEFTDGTLRDAIRTSQASERGALRTGRASDLATALAIRAALYNQLGEPDQAVGPATRAVGLLPRARAERGADPHLEPIARAILGETLEQRGHPAEALAQYDSGLDAAVPAFVAERGRLCNDRGSALLELGDVDAAARTLDSALAIRRAARDREGEAVVLDNQARVLQTVGRADSALVVLRAALDVRRDVPNAAAAAVLYNNVGYAFDLLALPESALTAYTRARAELGGGHPSYTGLTLLNRGRALLTLGRLDAARADLDSARTLKRQVGDAAGEAWVLHDLGRLDLARGELPAAEARLDSARAAMRALGDRVREGDALYFLGVVREAGGRPEDLRRAVADYAAAAGVRRTLARTAVRDEDRVMFAEQDVALTARWVLAWVALQATDPARRAAATADTAASPADREPAAAALAAAEEGRARALLDLMPGPWAKADDVRGDLRRATETLDTDAPLRALRDARTSALSYLVTDSALVTWLAGPDGRLEMDCARVPRRTLNALVRVVRAYLLTTPVDSGTVRTRRATMLDVTRPTRSTGCRDTPPLTAADTASRGRALAALARTLLPPALAAALPRSGDLVVVPHGVLALVPFAALPTPAASGPPTPFGVRFALRYAPSFAILAALGTPGSAAGVAARVQGRGSLIVGNPAMPPDPDGTSAFAALPSAGATAVWLATRVGTVALTDSAASKAAVLARLPDVALVHLGTHGRAYAGEARARQSFVALAPTATDSAGLLRVADILTARPLRAELVTLSACQTGLGDLTDAEGTIGFQRALLGRGARSMLVSLWQVPDAETDSLVRRFYRHWLDDRLPKAEALRRAVAAVRADRVAKSRGDVDGDAANPYYWAGFQLVGAP